MTKIEPEMGHNALSLVREYREMHEKGHFQGFTTTLFQEQIADMVRQHDAKTLLDYGSGKGHQYLVLRVQDSWGGILPVCYDPGIPGMDILPNGKFDGVICTDVLEHIPEPEIDWNLWRLFSYAKGFLLLTVCCRPAKKLLPNGENCHITVQPMEWWLDKVQKTAENFPEVDWSLLENK
jgi:hypothetical protein